MPAIRLETATTANIWRNTLENEFNPETVLCVATRIAKNIWAVPASFDKQFPALTEFCIEDRNGILSDAEVKALLPNPTDCLLLEDCLPILERNLRGGKFGDDATIGRWSGDFVG